MDIAKQSPSTPVTCDWDAVIVGGGLAGLCLARQLRLRLPELRVLVLERSSREIPLTTHKVGESGVEGGTHYLQHVLGLKDYLDKTHLRKLGLRFFGPGSKSFSERFELGALDFPPVPSVQFDRGIFETDLRRFCVESGVELMLGADVTAVEFAEGDAPHELTVETPTGELQIRTRWAIDASGRRRLFQQKLGLIKRSPHHASACWWRQSGIHDISDIAQNAPGWELRTRGKRWCSTNHILGHGYWVWLIPLSSNNTSIGIVTDERIHPVAERASFAATVEWLRHNEPELLEFLGDAEPMDFCALKEFAYTTQQAFSERRWACVGEAAVFCDPLYSQGTDFIAWANTLVTNLVEDDMSGRLSPSTVAYYDKAFLSYVDNITEWYRDSYHVFAHDRITLYKLLWDALHYFSFSGRALLHGALDDRPRLEAFWSSAERMATLNNSVQELFRRWAEVDETKVAPGLYHPFVSCPSTRMCVLGAKELERQPWPEFIAEQEARLERFQAIAAGLYHLAHDAGVELEAPAELAAVSHPTIVEELEAFLSPLDVTKLPTATEIRTVAPAAKP